MLKEKNPKPAYSTLKQKKKNTETEPVTPKASRGKILKSRKEINKIEDRKGIEKTNNKNLNLLRKKVKEIQNAKNQE